MTDKIVLVVDDNATNLKLVRFILKRVACVVREATDATSALAVVAEAPPSLILMDVQLPGMDGLTLTKLIKSKAETRGVPIIAVTAAAMRGDEQRALDAGCDAYVTKPIDTNLLVRLVEQFMQAS
ncbi:MAG TPA: response regulator [Byssovorax sp.]